MAWLTGSSLPECDVSSKSVMACTDETDGVTEYRIAVVMERMDHGSVAQSLRHYCLYQPLFFPYRLAIFLMEPPGFYADAMVALGIPVWSPLGWHCIGQALAPSLPISDQASVWWEPWLARWRLGFSWSWHACLRSLEAWRPNVVHSFLPYPSMRSLVTRMASLSIRSLVHRHDTDDRMPDTKQSMPAKLLPWMHGIFHCDEDRMTWEKRGRAKASGTVIPYALDPYFFRAIRRRYDILRYIHGLEESVVLVVAVGEYATAQKLRPIVEILSASGRIYGLWTEDGGMEGPGLAHRPSVADLDSWLAMADALWIDGSRHCPFYATMASLASVPAVVVDRDMRGPQMRPWEEGRLHVSPDTPDQWHPALTKILALDRRIVWGESPQEAASIKTALTEYLRLYHQIN